MSGHNHGRHHRPEDFDEFYAQGQQWSGNPNDSLVREVAEMTPGTALDVGCGEGADLLWLAEQGWTVVGVDPADAAVERSRALLEDHGFAERSPVIAGDISDVEGQRFDLVIGFYVPLPEEDTTSVAALEKLVAPGGTLLWVHHVGHAHAVLRPEQLANQLTELQPVKVENVERQVIHGAGAHHKDDQVLLARRDA
ncbi:class I SAM-dependent methyltransferase [Corynebacterium sp.]|uniref:class I SAM-dependent methyltransferase n=1 Tax=Corynebacterium sp. TaxID=1720 RepID=UPI00373677A0